MGVANGNVHLDLVADVAMIGALVTVQPFVYSATNQVVTVPVETDAKDVAGITVMVLAIVDVENAADLTAMGHVTENMNMKTIVTMGLHHSTKL